MSVTTQPLAREPAGSAVDRTVSFVKEGIQVGQFAPGQRLVETDLMELLKVSRSTIREALHRLTSAGLVELQQYKGARVRLMSRADVVEFNEIRGVLEGYAAATATMRIDEAGRKALKAIEDDIDLSGQLSVESYGAYNSKFHQLIIEIGRHSHLPQFIEQTRLSVFRLQFDFLLLTPERMEQSRREHRVVVAAILAGDPNGADAAMRKHIGASTAMILQAPRRYLAD
jgi:DNA-binding GntR family transcriptional regulator